MVEMMKMMGQAYAEATGNDAPSEEQAETVARKALGAMDADGDGMITRGEWLEYARQQAGL